MRRPWASRCERGLAGCGIAQPSLIWEHLYFAVLRAPSRTYLIGCRRRHGQSDLGDTGAHVAFCAKKPIVQRSRRNVGDQLHDELVSTNRSLPDRPREGRQLSSAAPSQCMAAHHVMACVWLRCVLRLCLGARVLLTTGKTTRHRK